MNDLKKIWNWMKSLSKRNKIILIVIIGIFLGLSARMKQASYNGGVGELTHASKNDWDKNRTLDEIGFKVFEFVKLHPEAKKLIVYVKDECTDTKGNKSDYVSTIIFNEKELDKFEEYQDKNYFTKNCGIYVVKMVQEWKPCGNQSF
jgi:hypothetical protein